MAQNELLSVTALMCGSYPLELLFRACYI